MEQATLLRDFENGKFFFFSTSSYRGKEKILKDLRDLNPNLKPLKILLYGPTGSGKSCFINTVQRVLLGRNAISALESSAGSASEKSFTVSIKTHKMKKHEGEYYPFVFCDIMGLKANSGGIQTEDIIKVLKGHILDDYETFQVIVLTKVDKACDMVNRDSRKLYHSRKIREKVEESSLSLGIPVNNIYPVKNYHVEITEDANIDVIILMALRDIVYFANDYAERFYEDQEKHCTIN
ncbi:hypothetical protein NFI96_003048 [Prochilodus magdalenae]|nr:hypothetical protein NFI96_003048 [Prochilodus magdalenae]